MPKVPSDSSTELAIIILKAAGISQGALGYYLEQKNINLLALQIDVAVSLIHEGHLTRASLALALAKEGLGVASLSEDHRITCGVALILATNTCKDFAEAVGEGGGADAATLGAAAPLTTAWIAASGASALSDLYGAYAECKPVAQESVFAIGGALDQMDRELTQWATQQDRGFRF